MNPQNAGIDNRSRTWWSSASSAGSNRSAGNDYREEGLPFASGLWDDFWHAPKPILEQSMTDWQIPSTDNAQADSPRYMVAVAYKNRVLWIRDKDTTAVYSTSSKRLLWFTLLRMYVAVWCTVTPGAVLYSG